MTPETTPMPDYMEPIVAWRTWNLGWESEQPRLRLSAVRYAESGPWSWPAYEPLEARHDPRHFLTPNPAQEACTESPCQVHVPFSRPGCGIYGFKTRETLLESLGAWNVYLRYSPVIVIVGQVYLWGRLAEHELGYRAQFAYPRCFEWLGNTEDGKANWQDIGTRLATHYGVPFLGDDSWKSAFHSDEQLQNHFGHLSQSGWSQIPLPPSRPLSQRDLKFPSRQGSSQYWYQPSNLFKTGQYQSFLPATHWKNEEEKP